MSIQFTKEEILRRINHFGNREYMVTTRCNQIIYSENIVEAMDLYESDEGIALFVDIGRGSFTKTTIMIAYKAVPYPVDINQLMYIRDIMYDIGLNVLECRETYGGRSPLHLTMIRQDLFNNFYFFCSELIDEKRLLINGLINKMYEAKLLHDFSRVSELVNEIVAAIELMASDSNVSLDISEDGTIITLPKIN